MLKFADGFRKTVLDACGILRGADRWSVADRLAFQAGQAIGMAVGASEMISKPPSTSEKLMIETLNEFAAWGEGPVVAGHFDNPWVASRARDVLKDLGIEPPKKEERCRHGVPRSGRCFEGDPNIGDITDEK
jgi:hypothetical protein